MLNVRMVQPVILQFNCFTAFRHAFDARSMKSLKVTGGQYGLGGFFDTVIVPILDEVESDNPNYNELLDIAK
jgi:hypothetical protein